MLGIVVKKGVKNIPKANALALELIRFFSFNFLPRFQ
jgi:hypothetical protein